MKTLKALQKLLILSLVLALAASMMGMAAAAESGDWDAAAGEMAALRADWQRKQSYLHITLQHGEINEADTLLHQCALYVDSWDGDALADAAVQLTLQFDRLAELEQLSIKNVL